MSSIDEVISRSRQPGTFTERRRFTVARGRAIQKLREFALVDPHFYILELIQSAVGNGATYIDIQSDRRTTALSYIGGSFAQAELAQLFDFLFASKDDVEHGPLRQLALGVNALMLFEPDEIIIETGDGTLKGTTRVVISGKDDVVEVGRPEAGLNGTYLRATGLKRGRPAIRNRSSLMSIDGHPREYHAVEKRCITAPVPILFNHQPLFGYSSQRTPTSIYGLRRTLTFDEGDFYGTIGLAARHSGAVFRLVTQGVWIESVRHQFHVSSGDSPDIGGIITFEGLRKTADHGSIVEDERYQEMWLRLRPYVNQLTTNQSGDGGYDVRTLEGELLEPREVMDVLRNFPTVIMVPSRAYVEQKYNDLARRIGDSLDAPVICVPKKNHDALRALAGFDVDMVIPDLDDLQEVEFYNRHEDGIVERPWLIAPVDLGTVDLLHVLQRLPWPEGVEPPTQQFIEIEDEGSLVSVKSIRQAVWLLNRRVEEGQSPGEWKKRYLDPLDQCIRARVYTPEDRNVEERDHNLIVRASRRVVWRGSNEAIAPGQVLVIEVSDVAPKALWEPPVGGGEPVAKVVADVVVERRFNRLESAANLGLQAALRADIEPGSNAANLVLASLSHRVVKRIRADQNGRRISFSLVDQQLDVEVLDLPLLKTLSGQGLSLRGIEGLMQRCNGLIYGARSDVDADLEGLDKELIVDLDKSQELMLISLIGPTAYVRVDAREVLAQFDGVTCRDVAIGLRRFPDFPLLVEGLDPTEWPEERQRLCVENLVAQLLDIVSETAVDVDSQENRRQAWRHLQYFAFRRQTFDFAKDQGQQVDQLPLFGLSADRTCSYSTLNRVLEEQGTVRMLDGWARGAGELATATAMWREVSSPAELDPFLLTMNPFVLHLLGDGVQGAAEHHLSQQEVDALGPLGGEVMLESVVFDDDEAQGVIGIPLKPVEHPAVVVFGTRRRDVVLRDDLGRVFGVMGKVRLRLGVDHEEVLSDSLVVEGKLATAARDVLSHLLLRLPAIYAEGDEKAYERALKVLLDFAGSQVQMTSMPDGNVEVEVWDTLARQILNASIFPGREGLPISAVALYREFCVWAALAQARGTSEDFRPDQFLGDCSSTQIAWLEEHLTLEKVNRGTGRNLRRSSREETFDSAEEESQICLEATLLYWINELRPDVEDRLEDIGEGENGEAGDEFDRGQRFVVESSDEEGAFKGELAEEFCQFFAASNWSSPHILKVNHSHWLSRWLTSEGETSKKPIAWALLAAYAHINNVRQGVTNDHELIFQRRVAKALRDGRLKMIGAPPG